MVGGWKVPINTHPSPFRVARLPATGEVITVRAVDNGAVRYRLRQLPTRQTDQYTITYVLRDDLGTLGPHRLHCDEYPPLGILHLNVMHHQSRMIAVAWWYISRQFTNGESSRVRGTTDR